MSIWSRCLCPRGHNGIISLISVILNYISHMHTQLVLSVCHFSSNERNRSDKLTWWVDGVRNKIYFGLSSLERATGNGKTTTMQNSSSFAKGRGCWFGGKLVYAKGPPRMLWDKIKEILNEWPGADIAKCHPRNRHPTISLSVLIMQCVEEKSHLILD